jgi:hypothetical protein
VCFEEALAAANVTVQDEVQRTWGRYSSVTFSGFQGCTPESAGVRVTFVDGCVDELGGIDRLGYPGPGGHSKLRICTSYVANGQTRTSDEALIRFLARHEFAHVLGFTDETYLQESQRLMSQALRIDEWSQRLVTSEQIQNIQNWYGPKPRGSLVTPKGECLAYREESGFSVGFCEGSAEQTFLSVGQRLLHPATRGCFNKLSGSDSVEILSCVDSSEPPAEQAWTFSNVEWRGFGGWCVYRRSEDEDLLRLRSELGFWPCTLFEPEDRTWHFEFAELGAKVRIRHAVSAASGLNCVGAKRVPRGNSMVWYPAMIACEQSTAWLDVTGGGQLAVGGNCFGGKERLAETDPKLSGLVDLTACNRLPEQYFSLSGRIETRDGYSLTRTETDGAFAGIEAGLTLTPTSDGQTFDYYF